MILFLISLFIWCCAWYTPRIQSVLSISLIKHTKEFDWSSFCVLHWRLWQMEDLGVWDIELWPTHTRIECQWLFLGLHRWMLGLLLHQNWFHHRGHHFTGHSLGLNTRELLTLWDLETAALTFSGNAEKLNKLMNKQSKACVVFSDTRM